MATRAEKTKMIEQIKGNEIIDFDAFIDHKWEEIRLFKQQFRRDWNSNHEKVEKQMEEKVRLLESLREEWLEIIHPDDKDNYKRNVEIQITIIEIKE